MRGALLIGLLQGGRPGEAQFHVACADVDVVGGSGRSGPTIMLPSGYENMDEGILFDVMIFYASLRREGGGLMYWVCSCTACYYEV